MNYRSLEDMNRVISQRLHLVPPDVRLVVGVPRSGLLAANLLALQLNLPLTDLDGLLAGRLLHGGVRSGVARVDEALRDGGRALVVDDSVCTGDAMARARRELASLAPRVPLVFAAIFAAPEGRGLVDLHFDVVPTPRVFEWNVLHHGVLPRTCVDIDGVLCPDPTPRQNDDGEHYRRFVSSTPPRVRPTGEIGWLVTGRLERYRPETEGWLRRHGIGYRNLVMLDLPDQATRRRLSAIAPFKARVYKEAAAEFFIESDPSQASIIAHMSGKHVYCVGSRQMIKPDHLSRVRSTIRASLGQAHWRLRRAARRWHRPYASTPGYATGGTL